MQVSAAVNPLTQSYPDFTMAIKKTSIQCCKGEYHVLVDGKYYCMAPPNIECRQMNKDAGKFTKGEKKILYCSHQVPCSECKEAFGNAANEKDKQKD
jgi:hypothetical protein